MSSRGWIVALGSAAAALVLAVRLWSPDAALDGGLSGESATGADRRTFDARGAAGGPGGAVGAPSRRGDAAPADRGERFRRRPPAPVAGVQEPAEQNAALPDEAAPAVTRRELPGDVKRDAQRAQPADDDAAEGGIDVVYNGGGEHVFDTGSQVEVADAPFNRGAGTVAFWLNPQWQPTSPDAASFVELGDGGLQIIKAGNALRFEYADGTGDANGGAVNVDPWQTGEWHYVTATWNGSTLALYVDGAQIFLNSGRNPPDFQSGKIYVGTSAPNGMPVALSELSHLTVLSRDVSADEIRQMYESGGAPPR